MGVMLHNRAEYGMGVEASPRKAGVGLGREVAIMLWIAKELIENSSLFQLVVTDGSKTLAKTS